MKLLIRFLIFISLAFVADKSEIKASNIDLSQVNTMNINHRVPAYKNDLLLINQYVPPTQLVIPQNIEYNFFAEKIKIKKIMINRIIFHFINRGKLNPVLDINKGLISDFVHYKRHSSKYYIFALRHILI